MAQLQQNPTLHMPHTFLRAAPGCPCACRRCFCREEKADGIRFHPHLQFPATTLSPQNGVSFSHVLDTRPTECQRSESLIDGAELEIYRAQDLRQGGW